MTVSKMLPQLIIFYQLYWTSIYSDEKHKYTVGFTKTMSPPKMKQGPLCIPPPQHTSPTSHPGVDTQQDLYSRQNTTRGWHPCPWKGTGHSQGQPCVIWRNWNAMLIVVEQAQITQLVSFLPFIYMKDNWDGNYRHSTIPRSRWFSTSTSSPRKYKAFSPILEPDLRESNISHKRETILFATLKYEARSQTSP